MVTNLSLKEGNLFEYVIGVLMVVALMSAHQLAHYLAYGQEWVDFRNASIGLMELAVGKTTLKVVRVCEVAVSATFAAWYPVGYLVTALVGEAWAAWTIRKKIVERRNA